MEIFWCEPEISTFFGDTCSELCTMHEKRKKKWGSYTIILSYYHFLFIFLKISEMIGLSKEKKKTQSSALTIVEKSWGFKDAPPTKNPSTSFFAARSEAVSAVTEPP